MVVGAMVFIVRRRNLWKESLAQLIRDRRGLFDRRHVAALFDYHQLRARNQSRDFLVLRNRAPRVLPAAQNERGTTDRGKNRAGIGAVEERLLLIRKLSGVERFTISVNGGSSSA